MPDLDALLSLARDIATEAAAFALDQRAGGVSVAATKSSGIDIVTQVDRDTEALIRRRLAEARPDDGFYGEEGEASGGTSGLTWVVDPIDGTVNFLYGLPVWAVSIAVVDGVADPASWRALAGVVVNPSTGEVFEARAGRGAFLGGTRLAVTEGVALDRALVATGFGYRAEVKAAQAAIVAELLPRIRDIRRAGSAALDLCALAQGRVDAFYESGLSPWDHAAGALIAREAGALITGAGGGAESAELLVAAAPPLQRALLAAVTSGSLPGHSQG